MRFPKVSADTYLVSGGEGTSPDIGKERARRNVRVLMVEKYKTQAALAEAAKVDAGTLGDFLIGKRWPHPSTLDGIERALGLQPDTIQGWADGRDPLPTQGIGQQEHTALSDATELDLVLELLSRIRQRDR